MAQALALLGRRTVDLSPLLTHTFPLSQIHDAFDAVKKRLGGAIKVLVKP
jgi:threonine dehydrogenase-like Zn-dependent dehydrogenase